MSNDKDILKLNFIKRRTALFSFFQISCLSVLVFRLLKLQIFENFYYNTLANQNSKRTDFILPRRGIIYDRNNIKMADIVDTTKMVYMKAGDNYMDDVNKAYSFLNNKPRDLPKILERLKVNIFRYPKTKFVLARNIKRDDMLRLNYNLTYLRGVDIERFQQRIYPYKSATSALVGSVGKPQEDVNSKEWQLQKNPDYRIGTGGIEKIYERKIGGTVGMKYTIVNVHGQKVKEVIQKQMKNGLDIKTTIDQRLQSRADELMKGKSGAITLLDAQTGEILAMHSTPNIDPNLLALGVDDYEWQKLNIKDREKDGIFINKNLASVYQPGSTFKIVSSLSALKNGLNPREKFKCTGEYKIGNRVFHCWKKDGHGLMDMEHAIAQSCNCYFYHLSTLVKSKEIYNMALRLGFANKQLEDFPDERQGFIPYDDLVLDTYKQKWYPGDNANFVIGQGYVSTTPLQLALMMARVATNKKITPSYIFNDKRPFFENLGIDPENLSYLKNSLYSVLNKPFGIAYGRSDPRIKLCGKTGSAQVVSQRIENRDMRTGRVIKEKFSNALFVGFAPFNDPKFAVSVVVEHGIGGSGTATPIAAELVKTAFEIYGLI